MYIQGIKIAINSNLDRDEIVESFNLLMRFYRGSGQTQGRIESQYLTDSTIVAMPFTLEENALAKKHNSLYVNKQTLKLEELCDSRLRFQTMGKTHESYEGPCDCEISEFYILMTNYVTINSPVNCGTCNGSVPLYRLPIYYDHGYMPILSWETNYISCDRLQMNDEVGVLWALKQMQEIDSELSVQGRTICKKIEELTHVPTYYYLYNYRDQEEDQRFQNCPSCGGKWQLKSQLHDIYDYQCNRCRIISNVSIKS